MAMTLDAKICGVKTPDAVEAAVEGGAAFIGLVFYPRSPRAVVPEVAAELVRAVPTALRTVGLFVDPTDRELERTLSLVPLGLLQLHGAETPERVAAIRARTGVPVMKALRLAAAEDLAPVPDFEDTADRLLFDAKLPPGVAGLPGGNGRAFDWTLLAGRSFARPWMLSGGLDAGNLAQAVAATGAATVDVSSGVESRPGHKDPALIRAFLAEVRRLQAPVTAK